MSKNVVNVSTKVNNRSDFLTSLYKNRVVPVFEEIVYDDIVDDSNFRLSSEIIRDKVATGNVGAGEVGQYDFDVDEKITPDNMPTDIELALRDGKLDKADIQVLHEAFSKKAEKDVAAARTSEALAKESKIKKNRDEKIDKLLGVNDTIEDSKV